MDGLAGSCDLKVGGGLTDCSGWQKKLKLYEMILSSIHTQNPNLHSQGDTMFTPFPKDHSYFYLMKINLNSIICLFGLF